MKCNLQYFLLRSPQCYFFAQQASTVFTLSMRYPILILIILAYQLKIYTSYSMVLRIICADIFASCGVLFRALKGRGKIRAMSKMSARITCKTIE